MNFSDPVLWVCVAVLILGFVFMIWAIGRFRSKKADDADDLMDVLSTPETSSLSPIDMDVPIYEKPIRRESFAPAPTMSAVPSSVLTPAFSKEVSDRLQSMTQHLADMQTVLSKQGGSPSTPSAQPGSIGQGLSPETIDKLLKIIGSVVSQVDVLQKSLHISKETPAAAPPPTAAPAAAHVPSGSIFTAPPPSTSPKISSAPKS